MYCKNCGNFVVENSTYCNSCGTRLVDNQYPVETDDDSNTAFAILGFFFPIVGLIIYLIYENRRPKRARAAAKGALIGFIAEIALSVIAAILYVIYIAVFASVFFGSIY